MRRAVALGLVFAVAAALISAASPARCELVRIRVASPSYWAATDSAPMFGKKLGFFAKEGLDPEFVAVEGGSVLIPQIANKSIDFGFPSLDLLLVALDKGEPYPVKAVYNFMRAQVWEFVALRNSPVKSLADLKGRKLGVGALSWGNLPLDRVILRESGVEWMKDVEIIPVGMGPAAWRRLTTGDIDVLNLFRAQTSAMEVSGVPIKRLPLPDDYAHLFSNGYVTSDDMIANHPQMIAGFGRALAKSYYACMQNEVACIKAYWDYNPSSKPPADKEAAFIEQNLKMRAIDRGTFTQGLNGHNWGEYDPAAWRSLAAMMHEGEQIKNASLPVDRLFTNQFVAAYNQWDPAAVRAIALKAK
jgi:NitT/TauT family transport system substrate-binding protein